ncbi:uncharacterized protein LOC132755389 [Ruditapes philippinarum]|uniref:uncharacterized protein LOC132755389 n=1 Tax=Ruditapes philippinarum TaxID=129788 RepID=UPI00295B20F1|nr:uncharacterized protein LOC132755389 [Ruditapes philippinarum]
MKKRNEDETTERLICNVKRCVFKTHIVLVIGELIVLLVLVVIWRVQRDDQLAPRQQQMCYPQVKLIVDDNTACPVGLVFKFDEAKNETTCCGKLNEILDLVSNKTARDRYNSEINPEIRTYDPKAYNCKATEQNMAVSRFGLRHERKPVSTGLAHKLFWENDHKSMEISGLRYSEEDGQVIVEGLEEKESYYISLQLKLNMSKATGILDETIRHRVHLLSDDTSAVLLEDVTSPCIMTSHTASGKTSVVGAVFRLKYGDRLYVTTTNPENIVSDPHNNYFSIHKL